MLCERKGLTNLEKVSILNKSENTTLLLLVKMTEKRFCGICARQRHYEFKMVFGKSCIVFCAKPKEVDPITLILYEKKVFR